MNRIRELRDELKWTQEKLGSMLNVKKAAISKYETGRTELTADTITILSKLFHVSSDYLLGISSVRNHSSYANSDTSSPAPIQEEDNYAVRTSFTEDEQKVLLYYNRLSEEDKDDVKGRMIHLYKQSQPDYQEPY